MTDEENKYTTLRLPPDIHQKIKVLAAQEGVTMIDYVTRIVNEAERRQVQMTAQAA